MASVTITSIFPKDPKSPRQQPSSSTLSIQDGREKYRVQPTNLVIQFPNSFTIGEAAHECVCEDALVHLKSYKYSSVDKSLISRYILKHYVRGSPLFPILFSLD